jgi:hypothetical protein
MTPLSGIVSNCVVTMGFGCNWLPTTAHMSWQALSKGQKVVNIVDLLTPPEVKA